MSYLGLEKANDYFEILSVMTSDGNYKNLSSKKLGNKGTLYDKNLDVIFKPVIDKNGRVSVYKEKIKKSCLSRFLPKFEYTRTSLSKESNILKIYFSIKVGETSPLNKYYLNNEDIDIVYFDGFYWVTFFQIIH